MKGMVGARKMCPMKDIPRLRELIAKEPNNTKIANFFTTHKGEKVTPQFICKVRNGQRWNTSRNSFIMKDQRGTLPEVATEICGVVYKTVCFHCVSANREFFQLMHYKNNELWNNGAIPIFYSIPTEEECIKIHSQVIFEEVGEVK